jgi:hypothetical protein
VRQLQHRFKKMQENIQTLVDGPLRTAEATFELERGELRGRILLLEQVRAQLHAWPGVLLATYVLRLPPRERNVARQPGLSQF